MQWSRLKHRLEERFAPVLRGRLALHQARYRYTREEVGRVWVTIDGREGASFDTASYIARRARLGAEIREANGLQPDGTAGGQAEDLAADAQAEDILRRAGEYDDYRALADLEASLSLPIAMALESPSPLVRALAIADARVGKRRLRALAEEGGEHPLVREVLSLRCQAEGIRFREPAA